MAARDPNDVVRLVTAPNAAVAHIWEQALQEEGIQAKVVGDYLDAGSVADVPGVRAEVWVHQHDVKAAEEILRRHQHTTGGTARTEEEE